jgi:UDP-N-acetylmuramoyl-tripeptide--D-alanyl-D-alanine ligase
MELRSMSGLTIIDDSYNANPDSMRAALDLLREAPYPGRRVAILGEMLELGPASQALHREIGAAASFVDRLFVIGPTAAETAAAAIESGLSPEAVNVARDQESLIRRVLEYVRPGDLLLVKGSRGMALEKVVQALEGDMLARSSAGEVPTRDTGKGM